MLRAVIKRVSCADNRCQCCHVSAKKYSVMYNMCKVHKMSSLGVWLWLLPSSILVADVLLHGCDFAPNSTSHEYEQFTGYILPLAVAYLGALAAALGWAITLVYFLVAEKENSINWRYNLLGMAGIVGFFVFPFNFLEWLMG